MDKIIKIILYDANTAYVEFKDKRGDSRLSQKLKKYRRKDNTYYLFFEKKRYDVDLIFEDQFIGTDDKNETLRAKGYYEKPYKLIRPVCPVCNQVLRFGVSTVGYLTKKIKEDGTLWAYTSRRLEKPTGETDSLCCPNNSCEYSYHFGTDSPSERNEEFERWHDVIRQDVNW